MFGEMITGTLPQGSSIATTEEMLPTEMAGLIMGSAGMKTVAETTLQNVETIICHSAVNLKEETIIM